MNKIIENKAFLFGDNIDTDQIYPGRYLELTDPKEIACHTMEGIENGFQERFVEGGIIVAGRNFGCGSSREHAPIALTALGTSLVIADSFARIFFRNAINLGLPLMVCKGIHDNCSEGDKLNINLTTGEIENISTGKKMQGEPFSEYVMEILESGGIKPLLRKQINQ